MSELDPFPAEAIKMAGAQVAARITPTQLIIHGLMVSMDAGHTGDLGFDSLLRNFYKNSNQHLALQGPPGGPTVCHHLPTSTKPEDNTYGGESGGGQFVRWFIQLGQTVWWTIRKWRKQP